MLFSELYTEEAIKTSISILSGDIPIITGHIDKTFERDGFAFKFNSLGYRCPEFTNSKSDLDVVTLGCSEAMGHNVGVNDRFSAVFCKLLSETTGKSVTDWNMGVAARSNDFIGRSTPSIIRRLRPNILLICFTYLSRREHIHFNGKTIMYTPGIPKNELPISVWDTWQHFSYLGNHYSDLLNFHKNLALVKQAAELACIPWLYSFVSNEGQHLINIPNFVGFFDHIDYGSDNLHAGVKSNHLLGERFFEQYKMLCP